MPPVLRSASLMSRRLFLRQSLAGASILVGLAACERREPLLRIASNLWPGFALTRLAAVRSYFDQSKVRLIEMPSATVCINSLAAGTLEGACLTLDELLIALAGGIALKVVCVLDVSLGADVLLAHPDIKALDSLKGRRIGVEQSAAGAVMLDAALRRAGLAVDQVHIVHIPLERQHEAFLARQVDALITFQPVPAQLHGVEVARLFSSADIPGGIVNVLAVRQKSLEQSPKALEQLLAGHFQARAAFLKEPVATLPILAGLLKLPPTQVATAYADIELQDVTANKQWLIGNSARLTQTAAELARSMYREGLLSREISVDSLADGRFLPLA